MKKGSAVGFAITLVSFGCYFLSQSAAAKPRPPLPPWPQYTLTIYGFDAAYWGGPYAMLADGEGAATLSESWSGYALNRDSLSLLPVAVPAIGVGGKTEVAPSSGAIRFWYSPNWTSANTELSGTGPGHYAPLVELVNLGSKTYDVRWSLGIEESGNTIYLAQFGAQDVKTCLQAPVQFRAGQWRLLTLCYSTHATALWVDGELIAVGEGVSPPASGEEKSLGLIVGSDLAMQMTAEGQFDELMTFDKWPKPEDEAFYFQGVSRQVALGPVSPEEEAALAEARAKRKAEREARGEAEDGEPQMLRLLGPTSQCLTNVPVYITNLICTFVTNQGWTVRFDIQGGTNGLFYDVFTTTNLTGSHVTNSQWFWLERGPTCSTYEYTNQPEAQSYYILGVTNDADHGGLPDAYEWLVTHGDTNNPADDHVVPLVSIYVTDSVAVEQQSTNTARFALSRLGGFRNLPLTVGCLLSGTATNGGDYSLSPVTTTATNVLVTFPPNQTSVELTLAAVNDALSEGAETATLTLTTNVQAAEVNPAQASATAWILEDYTRVYTLDADFNLGVLAGLEAVSNQLQFKTNLPAQFPFINVACSHRGTVARVNTTSGEVIGEYRTAPYRVEGLDSVAPNPSRTTVDQYGNVWVANRDDTLAMNGTNYGSITRLGLVLGPRYSKSGANYHPDSDGQYVGLASATYNTCVDRDGDGYIRTSRGLADILPWSNPNGVDSGGGVSTAEDETITEFVRVGCTGTRTIAVDKFNDIWVGGWLDQKTHLKVNGLTSTPFPDSEFHPIFGGGYGGVIDRLGQLWSSGRNKPPVKFVPPALFPPTQNDWQLLSTGDTDLDIDLYGIAVDPAHPFVWQTIREKGFLVRWNADGSPATNANGTLQKFPHGFDFAQGLVVDARGHVWVAHHVDSGTNIGHLDTNGTWLGNVPLRLAGLVGHYFANTNVSGRPVLTRMDGPVDFNWGSNAPAPAVPTNYFSARWSGQVQTHAEGVYTFYVSADAGAGFRLTVNGASVIYNWDNPDPNPGEISGTIPLGASNEYALLLEYKEFTGDAAIRLSWREPSPTNQVVIPGDRFGQLGRGPTGVSVDSLGNIWAANWNSNSVMRIDPTAGPLVVTNGLTHFVGAVDLAVDLGDGTFHPVPYDQPAFPYNYSDMTGFNNRVVNPGGQPLKGYWTVIEDSGTAAEWWQRISWNAFLTNGCAIEVFVRAADDRPALAKGVLVAVTNDAPLAGVKGRYIEVRVGLTRDDPSKHPVLYDLTLHGQSSGYAGDSLLEGGWAHETETAWFLADVVGPEPLSYQWYVRYPWTNQLTLLAGETNWYLQWTNADLWEDWSAVSLSVSNAAGEFLQLGPVDLSVYPLAIDIPGNPTNSSGPASRYPATIHVRGEPSNGLARVEVTLRDLRHAYPTDLDILLVSPSGTNIILMSDAGSSLAVTNATLVFHPAWQLYPYPPESSAIPSGQTRHYSPYNYGNPEETQLPGAPQGPYSTELNDLSGTDPNGTWLLYIYDDKAGQTGVLQDSWSLKFFYQ